MTNPPDSKSNVPSPIKPTLNKIFLPKDWKNLNRLLNFLKKVSAASPALLFIAAILYTFFWIPYYHCIGYVPEIKFDAFYSLPIILFGCCIALLILTVVVLYIFWPIIFVTLNLQQLEKTSQEKTPKIKPIEICTFLAIAFFALVPNLIICGILMWRPPSWSNFAANVILGLIIVFPIFCFFPLALGKKTLEWVVQPYKPKSYWEIRCALCLENFLPFIIGFFILETFHHAPELAVKITLYYGLTLAFLSTLLLFGQTPRARAAFILFVAIIIWFCFFPTFSMMALRISKLGAIDRTQVTVKADFVPVLEKAGYDVEPLGGNDNLYAVHDVAMLLAVDGNYRIAKARQVAWFTSGWVIPQLPAVPENAITIPKEYAVTWISTPRVFPKWSNDPELKKQLKTKHIVVVYHPRSTPQEEWVFPNPGDDMKDFKKGDFLTDAQKVRSALLNNNVALYVDSANSSKCQQNCAEIYIYYPLDRQERDVLPEPLKLPAPKDINDTHNIEKILAALTHHSSTTAVKSLKQTDNSSGSQD